MKIKYSVLLLVLIFSMIFLASCSNKEASAQLSLSDVKKLFKDNQIKLSDDQEGKLILKGQNPHDYIVDNYPYTFLTIYVFDSERQREKGRAEYDKRTKDYDKPPMEVYECKNIMVILTAGDRSNKIYKDLSDIMESLRK